MYKGNNEICEKWITIRGDDLGKYNASISSKDKK